MPFDPRQVKPHPLIRYHAGKAFRTGASPGLTRKFTGTVKIHESPNIYVSDTPGVMVPYLGKGEKGAEKGLKLALTGGLDRPHRLVHAPTRLCSHSFTHPFICAPTHSLTHSFTHPLVHAPTRSLNPALTHSLACGSERTHLLAHAPNRLLTPALTHSLNLYLEMEPGADDSARAAWARLTTRSWDQGGSVRGGGRGGLLVISSPTVLQVRLRFSPHHPPTCTYTCTCTCTCPLQSLRGMHLSERFLASSHPLTSQARHTPPYSPSHRLSSPPTTCTSSLKH
jgi:hypothetical protein